MANFIISSSQERWSLFLHFQIQTWLGDVLETLVNLAKQKGLVHSACHLIAGSSSAIATMPTSLD